jgi:hypothetical protein
MLQMSVRRDRDFGVLSGLMSSALPSDDLRRWLAGRWALLFSHPDDFASYGFEADRWLVYMQNVFDDLRLRPVAAGHDDGSGWVSQIGGRFIPGYEVDGLVPQLRGRMRSSAGQSEPEHFVTILDGSANARRTLLYRPGSQNPSIVELVQTAVHLRERGVPKSVRRILQSV